MTCSSSEVTDSDIFMDCMGGGCSISLEHYWKGKLQLGRVPRSREKGRSSEFHFALCSHFLNRDLMSIYQVTDPVLGTGVLQTVLSGCWEP